MARHHHHGGFYTKKGWDKVEGVVGGLLGVRWMGGVKGT